MRTLRRRETVGRKVSVKEGVLRESSGFDQRTVKERIRSGGVVGGSRRRWRDCLG
jgi:hypothetical protein